MTDSFANKMMDNLENRPRTGNLPLGQSMEGLCTNGFGDVYPLVNIHITMENHHFKWINQLFLWAIFNSKLLNYQRVVFMKPYAITMENHHV